MFSFKWILPQFSAFDPDMLYKEEILKAEEKIGGNCLDLYDQSYQFAVKEIGGIIEVGIKGGDWIEVITPEQKNTIDSTVDKLFECQKAKYSAERLGEEWPDFNDLHSLFSSLRTFSTRYGSGQPSARDLKPEALDRLMFDFRNVTNR
jgi:hypothetical protein